MCVCECVHVCVCVCMCVCMYVFVVAISIPTCKYLEAYHSPVAHLRAVLAKDKAPLALVGSQLRLL